MLRFNSKTEIVVSDDLAPAVQGIVAAENARRVGVVVDHRVAGQGLVTGLIEKLVADCEEVITYSFRSVEPTVDIVDEVSSRFRAQALDILVGIGGGSTIDLAKAVSSVSIIPGSTSEYHGTGKPISAGIKKIMVPTTAGTGSEVTPGAVLVNPKTAFKRALGGKHVCPDYAVLCAPLTVSMPETVTVATGMDAIAHAVESYTTRCGNLITRMYAREAFALLWNNLPKVLAEPANLEFRRNMLLGSCLAGYAIYNSNTGACHSMAYPLGTYHHVPHGVAVAQLLPEVVNVNVAKGCCLYADLLPLTEGVDTGGDVPAKARRFAELLAGYAPLKALGRGFDEWGVSGDRIEFLSERGLDLVSALSNNPVEFNRDDARRVLTAAAKGA